MNRYRLSTRHIILWVFAVLLVLSVNSVRAQAQGAGSRGSLSASLDKARVPVGAVVRLVLDYQLPSGGHLPDTIAIRGLEDKLIADKTFDPGRISLKLVIDNTESLETGPIGLKYLDKQGDEHWLETGGIRIDVVSNMEQKSEDRNLKPIRDIIPTQTSWRTWLLWGLPALLLFTAIAGLIIWYRRRKDDRQWQPEPPAPHVRAKRLIDDLIRTGHFEKGQYKAFYFRFSEILRHYLEDIRGFPAVEYTTEEIAGNISHDEDYAILGLLKQADLVKFADVKPTPARKDEEIAVALKYIDRTSSTTRAASGRVSEEDRRA